VSKAGPFLLVLMVAPVYGNSALIPRPQRIEMQEGRWELRRSSRISAVPAAEEEARKLASALSTSTGFRIPVVTAGARPEDIAMALEPGRKDLGDEGYELNVNAGGVRMVARRRAGLFYATQTFRQLLPAASWRQAPSAAGPFAAPYVKILDQPRFGWRGALLDPARHFISKSMVLDMIDAMAMHKLNRLQLHLTDDQGWRVEIRAFPRLTARSAWRDGTLIGHAREKPERYTSTPHGGYYTQEDIREIVAYAAARHIVVVPEIEMPGHARAWLSAYPEFAVFPEKAAGMDLWRHWGVSKDVLAPRPKTLEACRRILDEICELFPSTWIHIGGDEAPRDQWRESEEMQALIRTLGLNNEDELQAWFTAEMSRYLASKGRRLVGWDEILAGATMGGGEARTALAPNAIVMSWRGEKGGRTAAAAGHDVIMAPTQWTYLDYLQGPREEEPLGIGGSVSLLRTYAYEPVPADLPPAAAARVLGSQAQLWSEYMPGSESIGYMAFPRLCALAENFWSPGGARDVSGFLSRLEQHEQRLQAAGVRYRPLARRTSWPEEPGRVVAEARDAVIHGTDIVRRDDGALDQWKSEYTMVGWRVEIPSAAAYRVRLLLADPADANSIPLAARIGGTVLKPAARGTSDSIDFGVFKARTGGPHLLFLYPQGTPPAEGLPPVRAIEFVAER